MNGLRNRRGSYLVEAMMTLPICILAITAFALVIRIAAVCETIGFVTSKELKEAALQTSSVITTVSLCRDIETDVKDQCSEVAVFGIKDLDYLHKAGSMDDLIGIASEAVFTVDNPAGIHGKIVFSHDLLARAFSGTRQDASPLDAASFMQGGSAQPVLVYLEYGEKFHKSSCSIVQREKENGNEGSEMDRQDAERKGYSACMLCGGG